MAFWQFFCAPEIQAWKNQILTQKLDPFKLLLKIWVYSQSYKNLYPPRCGKNKKNLKLQKNLKKKFRFREKLIRLQ